MDNQYSVEIRSLCYTYPDGNRALSDVSLAVRHGEKVGIIGPNGAGKSTLLLHLNGIRRGEGTVAIEGVPVIKERLRMVRSKVGIVFEDPDDQLFCPTIFDDVAFGLLNMRIPREQIPQRVRETLLRVGLEGYEPRSSFHISLGEKKRAAMATVLAMQPSILVLDEPSSNLDPKNRRELIRLLQALDKTTVIASHDLDMVLDICTRAVILNQGKITADGQAEDILRNRDLLEQNNLELPRCLQGPCTPP